MMPLAIPSTFEDAREFKVFRALYRDPLATVEQVAKDVVLARSTTQKLLMTMRTEGRLTFSVSYSGLQTFIIQVVVNPQIQCPDKYTGQEEFANYLKNRLLKEKAHARLAETVFIERVGIVLGNRDCDIALLVACPDSNTICKFVTDVLRPLAGVEATATAQFFEVKREELA